MATRTELKLPSKENKLLHMKLPYYNCKDLVTTHPQFKNLIDTNWGKSLDSFTTIYDLGLFQINSADKSVDPVDP